MLDVRLLNTGVNQGVRCKKLPLEFAVKKGKISSIEKYVIKGHIPP